MAIPPRFAKSHLLGPNAESAPVTVDLFLDYCCPFSAKLFIKWHDEVLPTLNDKHKGRFQVVFRNVVQPWHPTSTLMHEVALAVAQIAPEKFVEFSYVLFKEAAAFYDGPTYDKTRKQIYEELSELAAKTTGLEAARIYDLVSIKSNTGNAGNAVTIDVKYFTRYHRTIGAHVTPTVFVGGVVVAGSIESSTSPEDTLKILETYL